eukprot:m.4160 g.4160  ORF g.4160 m.4160 type:complete len:369 (-) comp2909_c0_seq1:32-1138(-)
MMRTFVALMTIVAAIDSTKTVTIHNDRPRFDVNGDYVDAHDGLVVVVNSTYYLYGESYGNQTLATPYPWSSYPRLLVYTSPDMVNWTLRGDPLPMVKGTLWIPNVIYHKETQRFIMWYGSGGWGTATSTDGIHFTPTGPIFFSRFGPKAGTDGTGILVDDDGTGYVIFASSPPGFNHVVSIERLTPDLLSTTKENVSGFFPDNYVESPALFKRNGVYYVTYGSCCCGCAEGGGIVVLTSNSIHGPWVRQAPHSDINCMNASAPVCGGYGLRNKQLNELVFHSQWWGPSFIPLASGDNAVVFFGRRWLSGENHPTGCNDICGNGGKPQLCKSSTYFLKTDLSVWYPLAFNSDGSIQQMQPLPSFTLTLP